MGPDTDPHRPVVAQPVTQLAQQRPAGWSKPLLIFMGAATPGGTLFLLALLTEENINFPMLVWLILAAAGGAGGFFLHRRLLG